MHSSTETRLPSVSSRNALESMLRPDEQKSSSTEESRGQKRPREEDNEEDEQAHDEVRLWEDGFKDRYYESKFDVSRDNLEFRFVRNKYLLIDMGNESYTVVDIM